MIEVPQKAKDLIDMIVVDQEGGWKLTEHKDDPDGGWTFGGCTSNTFKGCGYNTDIDIIRKNTNPGMLHLLVEMTQEIYYQEYWLPLQLDKLPAVLQGPLFSAAVNIGVGNAVKCLQAAINTEFGAVIPKLDVDGKIGSRTFAAIEWFENHNFKFTTYYYLRDLFLREWTRHYIKLVEENSNAWWNYAAEAKKLANAVHVEREVLTSLQTLWPSVFRAADLEGWFNRVEYWR